MLSITTGCLVSPRHMEGIYDILNYMTGDNLFTHQLPRVADECRPNLFEQFPQLKDIDDKNINTNNWKEWLNEQVVKYGETLTVKPLPRGLHNFRNPIVEAIEMKC